MENLRYGTLEADKDLFIQAEKAAGIHEFADNLPGLGLLSMLN